MISKRKERQFKHSPADWRVSTWCPVWWLWNALREMWRDYKKLLQLIYSSVKHTDNWNWHLRSTQKWHHYYQTYKLDKVRIIDNLLLAFTLLPLLSVLHSLTLGQYSINQTQCDHFFSYTVYTIHSSPIYSYLLSQGIWSQFQQAVGWRDYRRHREMHMHARDRK